MTTQRSSNSFKCAWRLYVFKGYDAFLHHTALEHNSLVVLPAVQEVVSIVVDYPLLQ
jgi:hypothetical protein